eukprot:SAG11_NODE_5179_length_1638_cov_2.081871_1_plen_217_part_00
MRDAHLGLHVSYRSVVFMQLQLLSSVAAQIVQELVDGIELSGAVMLERSTANTLATLSHISTATGIATPAARSYDGRDWEGVAPLAEQLPFECGGSGCSVDLAAAAPSDGILGNGIFQMRTFGAAPLPSNKTAAQFLMQATFGPTRATVANLTTQLEQQPTEEAIQDWIQAQMALAPSLHREYYRRRVNLRCFFGIFSLTNLTARSSSEAHVCRMY